MKNKTSSFKLGTLVLAVISFIALAPETSANWFDDVINFFKGSKSKVEHVEAKGEEKAEAAKEGAEEGAKDVVEKGAEKAKEAVEAGAKKAKEGVEHLKK